MDADEPEDRRERTDDRRSDHASRGRIDELADGASKLLDEALPAWRAELDVWQLSIERRLSWAFRIMGIVVVLFAVGFLFVGLAGRSLYGRTTAQALQRAKDAQATAAQIQQERVRSLELSCLETNDRNRSALRAAKRLPPEARQVVQTFIESLAPFRDDCGGYARSRVGRADPDPKSSG